MCVLTVSYRGVVSLCRDIHSVCGAHGLTQRCAYFLSSLGTSQPASGCQQSATSNTRGDDSSLGSDRECSNESSRTRQLPSCHARRSPPTQMPRSRSPARGGGGRSSGKCTRSRWFVGPQCAATSVPPIMRLRYVRPGGSLMSAADESRMRARDGNRSQRFASRTPRDHISARSQTPLWRFY